MGTWYYLACKDCKEMVFIGKLREWGTFNKDLFMFLEKHTDRTEHNLVCVGDEWSSSVIIQDWENHTWSTDYERFDLEDYE